jgi:hypothetical protein
VPIRMMQTRTGIDSFLRLSRIRQIVLFCDSRPRKNKTKKGRRKNNNRWSGLDDQISNMDWCNKTKVLLLNLICSSIDPRANRSVDRWVNPLIKTYRSIDRWVNPLIKRIDPLIEWINPLIKSYTRSMNHKIREIR